MTTAIESRLGLSNFLLSCVYAVLPCFVVDGWRTSPLLAIWLAGTGLRWHLGDHQAATDCFIFAILNTYMARQGLKNTALRRWEELDMSVAAGWWFLLSRFAIPLALIALLARLQSNRKSTETKGLPGGLTEWTLQYPKPKIFPCQTKHARMFPKRHSFEYSYLQCGFPIIPAGVTADGTEVGIGQDRQLGSWWLRVKAEDYLKRGNGALGFYGKLKLYLREQVCSFDSLTTSTTYHFQDTDDCSMSTTLTGLMPTSSRHHDFSATPSTLCPSGIFTIQTTSSTR